jgi:hypothetical protein
LQDISELRFNGILYFGGQPYDLNAIVFWDWYTDEDGEKRKSYFTNSDSRQPITFPYTQTTEYREYVENAQ